MSSRIPARVVAGLVVALSATGACGGMIRDVPVRDGHGAAHELEAFASFVTEVHPEPFRFTSRESFVALVEARAEMLRSLPAPTDLEVGRAFQHVVASLHDSHMAVAQPAFQDDHGGLVSYLPVLVEVVGDDVFIDAALGVDAPRGTTLVSIDGHAVSEVIGSLEAIAIYEGVNEVARRRVVARDFVPLYHIAYGTRESYTLQLRAPSGDETSSVARGVTRVALRELLGARASSAMHGRATSAEPSPLPTHYAAAPATRVVRLPTFGVVDTEAYVARLDAIVAEVATSPRLILDLRGNEGGYRTYGIELVNHLTDVPYVQWLRTSVRVREIPAAFESRVDALFGTSLGLLRSYPRESDAGLHRLEGDPLAARMVPSVPHLPARIAILVDGLTNSAANELVLALRSVRPDAILIGEELGGECAGHVGELPVSFSSPVFGVAVAMSLIRIEHVAVPGCSFGHGLLPDIAVAYDRDDFMLGTDPYLEAALAAW